MIFFAQSEAPERQVPRTVGDLQITDDAVYVSVSAFEADTDGNIWVDRHAEVFSLYEFLDGALGFDNVVKITRTTGGVFAYFGMLKPGKSTIWCWGSTRGGFLEAGDLPVVLMLGGSLDMGIVVKGMFDGEQSLETEAADH